MESRRVALIGHSEAGKSSCLKQLNIDPKLSDMDVVLGTKLSPSLCTALGWLSAEDDAAPSLVVVSNHEKMLVDLCRAKLVGGYPAQFSAIVFVYLHKSKEQLRRHLRQATADGGNRDEASQEYTLEHYDRFDTMFSQLADQTVDCSDKDITTLALAMQGIVESLHKAGA